MWRYIPSKLIILCLVLFCFAAAAEEEPVRFKNVQVASAWFSKHYPGSATKKYVVPAGGRNMEIHAFYGP